MERVGNINGRWGLMLKIALALFPFVFGGVVWLAFETQANSAFRVEYPREREREARQREREMEKLEGRLDRMHEDIREIRKSVAGG